MVCRVRADRGFPQRSYARWYRTLQFYRPERTGAYQLVGRAHRRGIKTTPITAISVSSVLAARDMSFRQTRGRRMQLVAGVFARLRMIDRADVFGNPRRTCPCAHRRTLWCVHLSQWRPSSHACKRRWRLKALFDNIRKLNCLSKCNPGVVNVHE
jgi:hypothetical protein